MEARSQAARAQEPDRFYRGDYGEGVHSFTVGCDWCEGTGLQVNGLDICAKCEGFGAVTISTGTYREPTWKEVVAFSFMVAIALGGLCWLALQRAAL